MRLLSFIVVAIVLALLFNLAYSTRPSSDSIDNSGPHRRHPRNAVPPMPPAPVVTDKTGDDVTRNERPRRSPHEQRRSLRLPADSANGDDRAAAAAAVEPTLRQPPHRERRGRQPEEFAHPPQPQQPTIVDADVNPSSPRAPPHRRTHPRSRADYLQHERAAEPQAQPEAAGFHNQ